MGREVRVGFRTERPPGAVADPRRRGTRASVAVGIGLKIRKQGALLTHRRSAAALLQRLADSRTGEVRGTSA